MAQPSYAVHYLGGVSAKSKEVLTSTSILTDFPTATCLIMKTNGVKVSIDGTDAFPVDYGEITYLETGHSYIFTKDCSLSVGKFKVIT